MLYCVDVNTGEVYAYEEGTQQSLYDEAIANGMMPLSAPPTPAQVWDKNQKKFVTDLNIIKGIKIAEVTTAYENALNGGVTYNGAVFQSDERSYKNLLEVLTAVNNGWVLPVDFVWIDANNVEHPADATFLQGLANAFANHKSSLFQRLQNAKKAIRSATTEADINNVQF